MISFILAAILLAIFLGIACYCAYDAIDFAKHFEEYNDET